MGQKVNPISLRLGINKEWNSKWFSEKSYKEYLHEDLKIRKYIKAKYQKSDISHIDIERPSEKKVKITIHAGKPGIIIGKQGKDIQLLKKNMEKMLKRDQVFINIQEVKETEKNAQIIAENIANQLVRKIAFRRAMKRTAGRTMSMGCKGIRVCCSGRLGGAEMARTEWYLMGRVPLHTLRADIDYGFAEAFTTYGVIGVKVWIFKGEIINRPAAQEESEA